MATVFTKIINRELPAKVFHETDDVIVIADHRPRMPIHLLIIHKQEHPTFQDAPMDVISLLCQVAKEVADKLGIPNHYQLHVNNGYGQEIDHIHLHFMSNRGLDKLQYIEKPSGDR
ncbi:HIT domain-containing protein [candidate division GN15 bacterium]|nr:HIT domain-containing protein [candidate division GN15 bacterium]